MQALYQVGPVTVTRLCVAVRNPDNHTKPCNHCERIAMRQKLRSDVFVCGSQILVSAQSVRYCFIMWHDNYVWLCWALNQHELLPPVYCQLPCKQARRCIKSA